MERDLWEVVSNQRMLNRPPLHPLIFEVKFVYETYVQHFSTKILPFPQTNVSKDSINYFWIHYSANRKSAKIVVFSIFYILVDHPMGVLRQRYWSSRVRSHRRSQRARPIPIKMLSMTKWDKKPVSSVSVFLAFLRTTVYGYSSN